MKIFENGECWGAKINFVDDKNCFIGFDYSQSCCESFGYFLTRSMPVPDVDTAESDKLEGTDFPGYNFDTSFNKCELYPDGDGGGSVTFRLANDSAEEMFLTLYNHHNGYYGHGWDMRIGGEAGEIIQSGGM